MSVFKNVNTKKLTLDEIGLEQTEFTDKLLSIFKDAGKSESSLCYWIKSSNSWLGCKTPIELLDNKDKHNDITHAAKIEVAGIWHG
jgi:hypothetical protein